MLGRSFSFKANESTSFLRTNQPPQPLALRKRLANIAGIM